jgi:hypothetical protein
MSVYDHRDKPAYRDTGVELRYARNPHILKWWNSTLDDMLAIQISRWHWMWYWGIKDEIVKFIAPETIEAWKKSDPRCSRYAWYNVLMYFAMARAKQLGLTKSIRAPERKVCPLCNYSFIENSLPMPLVERLGIDRLDFCAPCLRDTVLPGAGNNITSEQDIIKYLQDFADILGCIPSPHFGEEKTDLLNMSDDERLTLLKLLKTKPSESRVKMVFGSWLNALIQAGVLEDGTRKTSRGIQSIAKDGHVCLSLGERTIDDYFHSHGIRHEKEPRYPEGNFRGDFKVGAVFIEYFGLNGNLDYDAKTREKIYLCNKHNIKLIAIYPEDLIDRKRLENKLGVLITEIRDE